MTQEEITLFDLDHSHNKYIPARSNFDNTGCSIEDTASVFYAVCPFTITFLRVSCEYFHITGFCFLANLYIPLLSHSGWVTNVITSLKVVYVP